MNRRYSPRSYNSLNSQTNNYNNLYSQFLNSFSRSNENVTDEIIDVEVTYNSVPENDEQIDDEQTN